MRRKHAHVHHRVQLRHVVAVSEKHRVVDTILRGRLRPYGVRLHFIDGADDQQPCVRYSLAHETERLEQLEDALLAYEPADKTDDAGTVVEPKRGAQSPPIVGCHEVRIESGEIDPVADELDPIARTNAFLDRSADVLRVLRQDPIRQARLKTLEQDPRAALQWGGAIVKVKSVERIHHNWHTREPSRHLAEQRCLRLMRVDDREALAAECPPETPKRLEVGERCQLTRERDRKVRHARPGDRLEVRTGRRHRRHVEPGVAQLQQLVEQQMADAHVHGRDVDDARLHAAIRRSRYSRAHSSKLSSSHRCVSRTCLPDWWSFHSRSTSVALKYPL